MAYIGNSPTNIQRGRRAQYHFTASVGQTAFTGTDDNGLTLDLLESVENDVYFNGARLILDDDYTISGDTLTLTAGAAAGDILVIVTQDDIVNLNSYTKAEADGRYINYDGDIINGDIQVSGEVDAGSLIVDTDVLVVDATNNNVGIGTTSPNNYSGWNTLEIDGTSGGVLDLSVNGTRTGTVFSNTGELRIDAHGASTVTAFYTNTAERMRIDSSGNVGIGTDSPAALLHVEKDGYPTLSVRNETSSSSGWPIIQLIDNRSGGGNFQIEGGRSTGKLSIRDNGAAADRITLDGSGNLGINTTSPTQKLHVRTGTTIRSTHARFEHSGQDSFYIEGQWGSYDIGSTNGTLLYNSVGAIGLRTGTSGNAELLIASNGNVGIGTTSPDVKLHVNESSSGSVAFFDAASNPYIFVRNSTASQSELATIGFAPANNVSGVELQAIAEEDFTTTANRSAAFSIRTRKDGNWGDRVYVTGAGNVGIGTNNPAAGLHIKSQGRDFSAGYFHDGYESDNGLGGSGERTHSLILESTSTAGQDIGSSIGFRVRSGNTLDDITVAAIVAAKENSTTSGDTSYDTQSDGYLAFYTNTDYDFSPYYGTKPIERMRIDSSGRVTMPYQPGFFATNDSSQPGYSSVSLTSSGVTVAWNVVRYNTGNHYNSSTHTFTVPVAGRYMINAQSRFDSITTYSRLFVSLNGDMAGWWDPGIHSISLNSSQSFYAHSISGILYLNVGDTIKLIGTEQNSNGAIQGEGSWSMCLIA